MAKKKWEAYVIEGTLIPWTEIWEAPSKGVKLETVEPEKIKFGAKVQFYGICKGWGSGCKVYLKDLERTYTEKNGEEKPVVYGVFLVDSYDIIMKMDHGILDANFEISKRGQDYGIKLVEED